MIQTLTQEQLNAYKDFLLDLLTPQRRERLLHHINYRTRHLSVVIENIFQPHNTSAVIRSCDCFGVQDLHVIECRNIYKVNPDIVLGANRWINIQKQANGENATTDCLKNLKSQGYKIVTTSPHIDSYTPDTLPLDQKIALVFGAEVEGVTREAQDLADYTLQIPMVGFTESLNISVSAAICMYWLSERIRNSDIDWQLSEREKTEILISWAKTNLKRAETIERAYFAGLNKTD